MPKEQIKQGLFIYSKYLINEYKNSVSSNVGKVFYSSSYKKFGTYLGLSDSVYISLYNLNPTEHFFAHIHYKILFDGKIVEIPWKVITLEETYCAGPHYEPHLTFKEEEINSSILTEA